MVTAAFLHGPLDGQTREIEPDRDGDPPLVYHAEGARYVLHYIDDRKGVCHYYIPSSERR